MTDRGTALLEVLAVGAIAALLTGQIVVTVGRLAAAGDAAGEAARAAATLVARYDDHSEAERAVQRIAPGSTMSVGVEGSLVEVQVALPVAVVGPPGTPIEITVRGQAAVPLSPYRSQR